ncbi:MYG1 family protein [Haloimpatiens sp. FM7315]|uniref:MYG1 family protein n=1 Tax=Haloimpatiens sp. FM7315 TaxID=3298609 RepID=UPI0035A312D7
MKKEFKKIGTHDGKFHADEVMATAMLNQIFITDLIRTRDKKILNKLDIVYDVNGGELDHHGIDKVLREDGIPYSSCGLVWSKYGKDIIKFRDGSLSEEEINDIFNFIDRSLIEGIDALDNGVWIDKSEIPLMNVSSILSGFNPVWYEKDSENENFNEAVGVAASILNNKINFKISVLKAKEKVIKAYETREIPQAVILDTYCPYIEALKEVDKDEKILFVIFKTKTNYIIQTVRGKDGEDRKKLPKAWLGKRDEELAKVTGVSDAIFCHTGRFIAVAGSLEGIKQLAQITIDEPYEHESIISKIIRSVRKLFVRK